MKKEYQLKIWKADSEPKILELNEPVLIGSDSVEYEYQNEENYDVGSPTQKARILFDMKSVVLRKGEDAISVNGRNIDNLVILWPGDMVRLGDLNISVLLKAAQVEPARQQGWGIRPLLLSGAGLASTNIQLLDDSQVFAAGLKEEVVFSISQGALSVRSEAKGDLQVNGAETQLQVLDQGDRVSVSSGLYEIYAPVFATPTAGFNGEDTLLNPVKNPDVVKWVSIAAIGAAIIIALLLL